MRDRDVRDTIPTYKKEIFKRYEKINLLNT